MISNIGDGNHDVIVMMSIIMLLIKVMIVMIIIMMILNRGMLVMIMIVMMLMMSLKHLAMEKALKFSDTVTPLVKQPAL